MVNACVRDRDAVVRVPFAVSKHYLCCYALVCAIVFATVWSGITADGRVSVKINCIWSTRAIGPTDTVIICSWCDHSKTHMPFTNDFLYLKTGARTNAPQRSNTCLLSQRKRQTGTLSAGMYFFRLAKLFVMSVALFKQILGEELVLSHFLVPGDEKKTIIKWKRPPFRRVAYSAPRDVCRCSICYGMTPIHYRGAKTTPKYGPGWLLPNFGIFVNMLPPTSRTPRNKIPALYAR